MFQRMFHILIKLLIQITLSIKYFDRDSNLEQKHTLILRTNKISLDRIDVSIHGGSSASSGLM